MSESARGNESGPKMPNVDQQETIDSKLEELVSAAQTPEQVFVALGKLIGFAEISNINPVYTHPDAGRLEIGEGLRMAKSMQLALEAAQDTTIYQDEGIPPCVINKLRDLAEQKS